MPSPVTVIRETRIDPNFPLSRRELAHLVDVILDALELTGSSLEIKLVDDGEIARLNRTFMGCEGPTNVLSFPAGEAGEWSEETDSAFMGALALSVDTLVRESYLYGQPPVQHLTRLLAHGILHLAGHEHGSVMYELTDAAVDRVQREYGDGE